MKITVVDGQFERDIDVEEKTSVLKMLEQNNIFFDSSLCNGTGNCGRCLMNINGNDELACQTEIEDEMRIILPYTDDFQIVNDYTCQPMLTDGAIGYGIAVDIGTTTVAVQLVDLANGLIIETAGQFNRQATYGIDVLTRIISASTSLPKLNSLIHQQIEEMTDELLKRNGLSSEQVYRFTVTGNTAMCYMYKGVNPYPLSIYPFKFKEGFDEFIGKIYIPPVISAYVGGDMLSGLLACGFDLTAENLLLVDVGTNCEMALGNYENIICCSTNGGAVFEGSDIECGMLASAGAINRVYIEDDEIYFSTIGNAAAKGICGSGLIDAIAVLLKIGIIDKSGHMEQEKYYFNDDVYISQSDIRKVQSAKSAIRSGIDTLISRSGKYIDHVILAGGFGSYIDIESACAIGMLPKQFIYMTSFMGNTALQGAAMVLCNCSQINRLRYMKQKAHYIELSNDRQFNELYIENMSF